jgi:type II secretion system protein N
MPTARGGPGSRRLLLILGILGLFVVFVAARFPYERLLPAARQAAAAATGAQIEIAELGLGMGWGGPEAVVRGLVMQWPGSEPLRLERVGVRPAWTPAWLRGEARWHVAASGPPGEFSGEVAPDRVDGELTDVDTGALPWAYLGTIPPIAGRVSGLVDLAFQGGQVVGLVDIVSENGSVDFSGLPVAIPYESLAARVELAPSELGLTAARLAGPLITARFSGSATPGPGAPVSWPLALQVHIEQVDPALRNHLAPLGIRLNREGQASLAVSGSLGAPRIAPISN